MSDISENISLPPGWDTKYDFKTGRRYYINYFTKHTSLEDPRIKYKKLQAGDSFTFQSYQNSPVRSYSPQPFYHMHQDINFSSGRPSPIMGRSYSPLMGSNAIHYLAQKPHDYPSVETSVAKIKALFPTVGETHIKTLLHKYHNREAVVVSALQVEKHPLTTPGPYSSPLQVARHVISQIAPFAPSSPGRFSFSSAFRNLSPRRTPHSSPKMKLRTFRICMEDITRISLYPVFKKCVSSCG